MKAFVCLMKATNILINRCTSGANLARFGSLKPVARGEWPLQAQRMYMSALNEGY